MKIEIGCVSLSTKERHEEVGSKQPCFTEPRMHVALRPFQCEAGTLLSYPGQSHIEQARMSQSSSSTLERTFLAANR